MKTIESPDLFCYMVSIRQKKIRCVSMLIDVNEYHKVQNTIQKLEMKIMEKKKQEKCKQNQKYFNLQNNSMIIVFVVA